MIRDAHRCARTPRRGMMLMEILPALAILGVFTTVCTQLYTTTMRLHREAMSAGMRINMTSAPLDALRDDHWMSLTFEVTDPANVAIQQWENRTIAWAVIESQEQVHLERSVLIDGRMIAQLRWPLPRGTNVHFEADGHLLGVILTGDEFHRAEPLWLTSQLHTIEEARR